MSLPFYIQRLPVVFQKFLNALANWTRFLMTWLMPPFPTSSLSIHSHLLCGPVIPNYLQNPDLPLLLPVVISCPSIASTSHSSGQPFLVINTHLRCFLQSLWPQFELAVPLLNSAASCASL